MPERDFYLWHVQGFTARLRLDVIGQLNRQLGDPRRNSDQEHGGILLGRTLGPTLVEITGFEFLHSEHRRGILYDLGARERARVARYVQGLSGRRGRRPVGYFRTHRRPGLFLDQDDFMLMSEVFAEPSSVALVIRSDPRKASTSADAGIFFWQDHDIDRKQSQLIFPFDVPALRARGPIHREVDPVQPAATKDRLKQWPRWPVAASAFAAAGAVAILTLATFAALPRHRAAAPAKKTAAPDSQQQILNAEPSVPSPEPDAVSPASAVSTAALPESEAGVEIAPPMVSRTDDIKPHRNSPVTSRPPAPKSESSTVEIPKPAPEASPEPAPEPAAERPAEAVAAPVVPPAPRERRVAVEVAMDSRQPSEIRKVIGRVPLLGRLHRFRNDEDTLFQVARPQRSLVPRVPDYMAANLEHEIPVDVKFTIDKEGRAKNIEVTRGAGTGFGSLAADAIASETWSAARVGDRAVSSEVIVHYRFRPLE